jgi:hypothetical protein
MNRPPPRAAGSSAAGRAAASSAVWVRIGSDQCKQVAKFRVHTRKLASQRSPRLASASRRGPMRQWLVRTVTYKHDAYHWCGAGNKKAAARKWRAHGCRNGKGHSSKVKTKRRKGERTGRRDPTNEGMTDS